MKNQYKLLILVLLAFALAFSVKADTATLTYPVSGSILGGINSLNSTVSAFNNYTNATYYAYSSSTANSSSLTQINISRNATNEARSINGTFNTLILEDASDYIFYVTYSNGTATLTSSTITGVIIDNTVPNTPTSLSPVSGTKDEDGSVTFSASVTDRNTTSCNLIFNQKTYSMTYSTTSCTYTLSDIPEYIYTWYIIASDGKNSTNSPSISVTVDKPTSANKGVALINALNERDIKVTGAHTLSVSTGETSFSEKLKSYWWIIALIILIIVIYYLEKRRRR